MSPPRAMDFTQQYDQLLGILQADEMFEVSASMRRKRLQKFFSLMGAIKEQLQMVHNVVRWDRLCLKWTNFHRRLCDHEPAGEYLACFISNTLQIYPAFGAHVIFVYRTVAETAAPGSSALDTFKLLAQGGDRTELIKALKENCHTVPTKVTFKYLHARVLPAIFTVLTSDDERRELCDLVLALPMGFAVQYMHRDTQARYKHDVIQKYIKFIYTGPNGTFRSDWCTLCKALVHYSGKLLHIDTNLQNAILKVIEEAFKNASVEMRCAAFDCWQMLIDNYALERKYITHAKQSLLLLKPLRARISRNHVVASKKYDVYVHLLRRIGFPASVVDKFLTDAFGPFTENVPDSLRLDSVQNFKDLTSSYAQSTEVLLKALGHRAAECVCAGAPVWVANTCGGEAVPLDGAISDDILVQCVRLCSQLNANSLINARPGICETLTKCVWSTMFRYFQQERYAKMKKGVCVMIEVAIFKILRCSAMNANYYNTFVRHILSTLIAYLNAIEVDADVYSVLVMPTIRNLISCPIELSPNLYQESLRPLLVHCDENLTFLETLRVALYAGNTQMHADVLAYCVSCFGRMCERNAYKLSYDNTLRECLRRLVEVYCNPKVTLSLDRVYIHLITSKMVDLVKLYVSMLIRERALRPGLFKILAVTLSYVVNHDMIATDTYTSLLDVIVNCIQDLITVRSTEMIQNVEMAVSILTPSFERIAAARNDKAALNIEAGKLVMIHHLLLKLGVYSVLETLAALIDFVEIAQMPKGFYELITTLTDNSDEEVAKRTFTVFGKIHLKHGVNAPTAAAAVSANGKHALEQMAPKVTILSELVIPAATPSVANSVKIFGKYFDSPPPKAPRASVLAATKQTTSPSTSRTSTPVKHANPPNLEELSASAFVAIDKEVVVDVAKMTDHQKEAASKRGEIPAMYEDLTQSNSLPVLEQQTGKQEITKPEVIANIDTRQQDKLEVESINEDRKENNKPENLKPEVHTENTKIDGESSKQEVSKKRGKKRLSLPLEAEAKKPCVEAPPPINEEDPDTDEDPTAQELRKSRALIEFKKLQIDIVDGDKFFNLSRTRRRKSAAFVDTYDYYAEGTSDESDVGKLAKVEKKVVLPAAKPGVKQMEEVKAAPAPQTKKRGKRVTSLEGLKDSVKSTKVTKTTEEVKDLEEGECKDLKEGGKTDESQNEAEKVAENIVGEDSQKENDKADVHGKKTVEKLVQKNQQQKETIKDNANKKEQKENLTKKDQIKEILIKKEQLENSNKLEENSTKKEQKENSSKVTPTRKENSSKKETLEHEPEKLESKTPEKIDEGKTLEKPDQQEATPSKPQVESIKRPKTLTEKLREVRLKGASASPKEKPKQSQENLETPKVNKETLKISNETPKVNSPKLNLKQKPEIEEKQNADPDSESIIPSSQECTVNLFRLPHYSPTRQELQEARTRHQKTEVQCASEAIIAKIDFASLETSDATPQEVDKDETYTLEVIDNNTSKSVDVALLDTESFIGNKSLDLRVDNDETCATTPTRGRSPLSSLGTSPITNDTPSRTQELLENTLEISPIKTAGCGDGVGRASPDLFGSEGGATAPQETATAAAAAAGGGSSGSDEDVQMYFKEEVQEGTTLKNPSSRSAKLLHLIGHTSSGARMSPRGSVTDKVAPPSAPPMSPSTGRIRRMMQNCGDSAPAKPPGVEELQKMQPENILEFDRALPSPLALPKVSILKRKMPDTGEDGLSPCAKRKRVNFPDPPTTCEKMYFKNIEEKEKPIALRKKKRFMTRLLTSGDADTPADDASADALEHVETSVEATTNDAIQSMQQQIDGLEMDGVVPLDSLPPKEDRLTQLPTNPAPELLPTGSAISTAYEDLFPGNEPEPSPPPPPQQSMQPIPVLSDMFMVIRKHTDSLETYVECALHDIPLSIITQYTKKRKANKEDEEADT